MAEAAGQGMEARVQLPGVGSVHDDSSGVGVVSDSARSPSSSSQNSPSCSSRGKYEALRKYASSPVVEEVKTQRERQLQGLALDWKMHRVVQQKILCMREQEVFKKDEHIGQVAVRFTTLQVRRLSTLTSGVRRELTRSSSSESRDPRLQGTADWRGLARCAQGGL